MGLDMYLTRDIYIGGCYEHNEVKGEINITKRGKEIPIDLSKLESVTERVAYWRKANQIHNWFVQNVQNGKDDCGRYYVSYEKLKELVSLCKKVLRNHSLAEELLPTTSGFFFGSTDIDEYYFEDLKNTVEQLKDIDENSEYYYESSW